jgi:hypothetical protein
MNPENAEVLSKAHADAVNQFRGATARYGESQIGDFLNTLAFARATDDGHTKIGEIDITRSLEAFDNGPMARANAQASWLRKNPRATAYPQAAEIAKSDPRALAKAAMDVGTLTDFARVTGGQSLGFVSLDTNMARGTIRPGSFTLYQMLKKTRANQVVDFWPYAAEIGGALPGAAFNSYASVGSGTLATSAGQYKLNTLTLRLALDGRAITAALAAQNSFVDVTGQETTNASLVVLSSLDWALFWGNPNIWPNQPSGLYQQISGGAPAKNIIDFQVLKTARASLGLTDEQMLFNLIFQQVAEIVQYRVYGIPTHAVMGVGTAGDLQQLVTQQLQNVVNVQTVYGDHGALVVNGNLQGMNTRFGAIHFPVDLLMTARDIPAAAITYSDGTLAATSSAPTPPASVTLAISGAANAGSDWVAAYVASSGVYTYGVATCDSLMNESTMTYVAASGVTLLGAYVLTINAPAAHDQYAYRIYRSGLGFNNVANPAASSFRHVGDVIAAPANAATTFVDLNTKIPGSESVFILDLDEQDDAFDYRWLLPLSKIELFAQNLYMPWAVAHIGAPRVRIPKFHGMITNYTPQKTDWNPLAGNSN